MKITLYKRIVRAVLISGLALLTGSLTSPLQAQLDPSVLGPAGWDFTVSGNARGIAHLTFDADFTLSGTLHIETRKKVKVPDVDARGGLDDRTGGNTNSGPTSVTNFFGGADVTGRWSFDSAGRNVIGYLNEASDVYTETSTNTVVNTLTFRGVLHSGSRPRFTLVGTGPLGRQTFQGVPLQPLPDISGDYAAVGRRAGHSVVEFFTLQSSGENMYTVSNGGSPGLIFSGDAILSARKQLSLVTLSGGPNAPVLTMVVGSFSTNKLTGRLNGRDTHGAISLKVFSTLP